MPDIRQNGDTSNRVRLVLSKNDGTPYTGLTNASSGLVISTVADNETGGTAYSGANIQTISTIGTFAAPSSGKCRFGEVDATNHPGLYELQFLDTRFAVSNAKRLIITVSGVTSLVPANYEVEFTPAVDVEQVAGSADAATRLEHAAKSPAYGTVGSGSTASSINVSSISPAPTDSNQFQGLLLKFDADTTTTGLRGQGTPIITSGTGATPTITVSTLTSAPVSGDKFTIQ